MAPFLERQLRMGRGSDGRLHLRGLEGSQAGGTILYIHGLGESALCFERLMADPRLAAWAHLAVDLEGYGKSLWAPDPLSLAEHARRLGGLIRLRRLAPVVVLGHSMGGVIGTFLCERQGDSVAGFVNVEGNISPPDCGYSGRAVKFPLGDWLAHGFDRVLDAIYDDGRESAAVRRAYGASIQMCDPRAYHHNSEELVSLSRGGELASRMASLEPPGVYLHGVPRGTCDRSLALLAAAGVETVPVAGAGHWPFLDRHDAFVEALLAFLERLDARTAEVGRDG